MRLTPAGSWARCHTLPRAVEPPFWILMHPTAGTALRARRRRKETHEAQEEEEEEEEGEEVNEEVLAVGWRSVHHHVESPAVVLAQSATLQVAELRPTQYVQDTEVV
ncbi:unnamed protein product [Arctogadus glacialis]